MSLTLHFDREKLRKGFSIVLLGVRPQDWTSLSPQLYTYPFLNLSFKSVYNNCMSNELVEVYHKKDIYFLNCHFNKKQEFGKVNKSFYGWNSYTLTSSQLRFFYIIG